ncbi:MAG: hypothetical protein HY961_17295, partial [Ignavibacteriae bacterium]|nr:hypothetical protein [Ignavibacteriota bacterium]
MKKNVLTSRQAVSVLLFVWMFLLSFSPLPGKTKYEKHQLPFAVTKLNQRDALIQQRNRRLDPVTKQVRAWFFVGDPVMGGSPVDAARTFLLRNAGA